MTTTMATSTWMIISMTPPKMFSDRSSTTTCQKKPWGSGTWGPEARWWHENLTDTLRGNQTTWETPARAAVTSVITTIVAPPTLGDRMNIRKFIQIMMRLKTLWNIFNGSFNSSLISSYFSYMRRRPTQFSRSICWTRCDSCQHHPKH